MSDTDVKYVDQMLWIAVTGLFVVLVILSFVRIDSYQAFIDLKASSLQFGFDDRFSGGEVVDFGAGAEVVDDVTGTLENKALLTGIEAAAGSTGFVLKTLASQQSTAAVCLNNGEYFLHLIRADRRDVAERTLLVEPDQMQCITIKLTEDLVVLASRLRVARVTDLRGVDVFPAVNAVISIENTQKTFTPGNGEEFSIRWYQNPSLQVSYREGMFGLFTRKLVEVARIDGEHKKEPVYYTPLDVLKKYMEDNSLWYSVSLLFGAVFGLRKVLQLRL